jgi:hypothetical protein
MGDSFRFPSFTGRANGNFPILSFQSRQNSSLASKV